MDLWRKTSNQHWMEPKEELTPGCDENWETWKALNRLLTGTARSRDTLNKWGYPVDSNLCECGVLQTMLHMYTCPLCPAKCTIEDFMAAKPNAIDVARFWARNA